MLSLILDVVLLMALIRVVVGDDGEGLGKPLLVVIVAATIGVSGNIAIAANPDAAIYILTGVVVGAGLTVFLGILALFPVEMKKAAIVAACFAIYKSVFSIVKYALFAN